MKLLACIVVAGLLVGCSKEEEKHERYDGDSSKVAMNETNRT